MSIVLFAIASHIAQMSAQQKALVNFFIDLQKTHYAGRVYTKETLNKVKVAKTLGLDLKALNIYPIGLVE